VPFGEVFSKISVREDLVVCLAVNDRPEISKVTCCVTGPAWHPTKMSSKNAITECVCEMLVHEPHPVRQPKTISTVSHEELQSLYSSISPPSGARRTVEFGLLVCGFRVRFIGIPSVPGTRLSAFDLALSAATPPHSVQGK
jgi:hypothetical protein